MSGGQAVAAKRIPIIAPCVTTTVSPSERLSICVKNDLSLDFTSTSVSPPGGASSAKGVNQLPPSRRIWSVVHPSHRPKFLVRRRSSGTRTADGYSNRAVSRHLCNDEVNTVCTSGRIRRSRQARTSSRPLSLSPTLDQPCHRPDPAVQDEPWRTSQRTCDSAGVPRFSGKTVLYSLMVFRTTAVCRNGYA